MSHPSCEGPVITASTKPVCLPKIPPIPSLRATASSQSTPDKAPCCGKTRATRISSPLPTALPVRALSITWNGSCTPNAALPVSSSRDCAATGKILNCHGAHPASARWTPSKATHRRNAAASNRSLRYAEPIFLFPETFHPSHGPNSILLTALHRVGRSPLRDRPPISNLQSPISNLQSLLLPFKNQQSSIFNLQSSIFNLQYSIFNHQSSIRYIPFLPPRRRHPGHRNLRGKPPDPLPHLPPGSGRGVAESSGS